MKCEERGHVCPTYLLWFEKLLLQRDFQCFWISLFRLVISTNLGAFFFLFSVFNLKICFLPWEITKNQHIYLSIYLFCRMACLQSTWQRRATTWTASNSFYSTTQRLMTSHWTTSPLCMWRHTAVTTVWPKYCWTKGPNPTLGLWLVTNIL